ncbi:selenocysteine-specific translation elongation factor [Epidermidibacterium keratini]|uniref:Selenocysteine-specific translation elongation factor n=1 Tax=Epidermidibacterium keratini TaxID=1891644 RepID=A0A7L4YNZ1_9ACTN|nr:selenocysteine-specific translation elongation factor [Epidermidibacterium keratini]QHC00529.1 selenocysteine-specific translation elongation factor [Epidermidibacterium keratini]
MYVVATAGHVDHGKSALVRALTDIEPDRWAEERRRGLTIDLGFAWTTLPSGQSVSVVDVPGHERFIANMLAGIGPAPVVLFVVAADEGWMPQSSEHRDALAALGIERGIVVLSKSDLVSDLGPVTAQVRAELAETGLRDAPIVSVSARTGAGMAQLRDALGRALAESPEPSARVRVRLWVDRSFTIAGAGTVVTGTLAAGRIESGDRFDVLGEERTIPVTVRGVQSQERSIEYAEPIRRVALNLRGVRSDDVRRGDALVRPGEWRLTDTLDVRRVTGRDYRSVPAELTAHVGTAAVPARLRPLDADAARLTLARPLPLVAGDRVVLRDPGAPGSEGARIVGGAVVLDTEPPELRRRGDAARRAAALDELEGPDRVRADVQRRGAVRRTHLQRLGLDTESVPAGVRVVDEWWIAESQWTTWRDGLVAATLSRFESDPLGPGLSQGAALDSIGLPDPELLAPLAAQAEVELAAGHLRMPGTSAELGSAAAAVAALEDRLRATPFAAPESDDLVSLGLGARELAAAERAGRVLRLRDGVVLLPDAPALAMRELARLQQPFTTSAARQALGTTRRVAIPLLEHLDARGWTRRLDAGHREVVR